jgi:hypothetical protein
MTTLSADEQYAIQQLVDERLDKLIIDVRDLVNSTEVYLEKNMGKAQFSQLTTLARDTESVEVIILWIEYQMGRSRQNENWRKANGRNQAFGDLLKDLIRGITEWSHGHTEGKFSDERHAEIVARALTLAAVRQFLGQMERYAYARKELAS